MLYTLIYIRNYERTKKGVVADEREVGEYALKEILQSIY